MDSEFFITCDARYTNASTNATLLANPDIDYQEVIDNVCATQGVYNVSSASSSGNYFTNNYEASNSSQDVMYVDSTELNYIYIEGRALQDDFHFLNQSLSVPHMNFILANYSNVLAGGLGLALGGMANNFLQSLVDNQEINSTSYSLYLGRMDSPSMELHLGGIDTSKIKGDFVEFDFIPYIDESGASVNDVPIVPLTGVSVTSGGTGLSAELGSFDNAVPALLDSRTYFSYLPYDVVIDLALQMNAFYSSTLQRWLVDCSIGYLAATVDFKFGNLTVHIPLSELIYLLYDDDNNLLTFQSSGASLCFISVLPQEYEGLVLLGTPFLRNIYLAVDLESRKLAMSELYVPYYDDGLSIDELLSSEDLATTTTSARDREQDGPGTTVRLSLSPDQTSSTSPLVSSITSRLITKRPIVSGTIPYARSNNITSYEALTLTTMSQDSTGSEQSDSVVISNGEIIFRNSDKTDESTDTITGVSSSPSGSLGRNSNGSNTSPSTVNAGITASSSIGLLYGIFAICLLLL